jgi:hypothetical protein
MPAYTVTAEVVYLDTFVIEADSPEHAKEIAEADDFVLDCDDTNRVMDPEPNVRVVSVDED